ncbi:MAG: S-layer homology domain-containing protein [Thermincola sp.]|jgi:hypothetical protein|nr:S-layer homology domain-containing protein [Thermincola sp.]
MRSVLKKKGKFLVLLITLTMFSLLPAAAVAAAPSDIGGHWASGQLSKWSTQGLISGYPDGTLRPEEKIKRAEFFRLINSVFGFQEKASVAFSDVPDSAWYYQEIAKAVAAGYISGYPNGTIKPESFITRQEAAVITARVFGLNEASSGTAQTFADHGMIGDWASNSVSLLKDKAIIDGHPNGSFGPANNIKRGEAVILLSKAGGEIYNTPATYSQDVEGNLVINTPGVTLKNMTIKGDLYLAEGIGEGDVTLDGVTVKGKTYVQGGGENSIVFLNSALTDVVVKKPGSPVRVVAKGNTTFSGAIQVAAGAVLQAIQDFFSPAVHFKDVVITEKLPPDGQVRLVGEFHNVKIAAKAGNITVDKGNIAKLETVGGSAGSAARLDIAKAVIGELNVSSDTFINVAAGAKVGRIVVGENAAGAKIQTSEKIVIEIKANNVMVNNKLYKTGDVVQVAEGGATGLVVPSGSSGGGSSAAAPPTALAKVSQPAWNGDSIQWVDIANESGYALQLYKDSVAVGAVVNVAAGSTSYDFGTVINDQGPGSYKVTIKATGDGVTNTDGLTSDASGVKIKLIQLAQVDQPTWDGDIIRWNPVENADSYVVEFYKDGVYQTTKGSGADTTSWDFGADITTGGLGSYTVTVKAAGDGITYGDGLASIASAAKVKALIVYDKVDQPYWGGDGELIQWNGVENGFGYDVRLYKNGTLIQTIENTVGTGFDLGDEMTLSGSYTVTVTARGDGTTYADGPTSDESAANVVPLIALAKVGQPAWNGYVIQWVDIANESGYDLQLYKDNVPVGAVVNVAANITSYNFGTVINNQGVGSYKVTVKARGDGVTYTDGLTSDYSGVRIKLNQLAQVDQPAWEGDIISWNPVANAHNYVVELYRDNAFLTSRSPGAVETSCDFGMDIAGGGLGSYTVTVRAAGDGITYGDGLTSIASEANVKALIVYDKVDQPYWGGDGDVIMWNGVNNGFGYDVRLYRNGTLIQTVENTAGTGFDLGDYMTQLGSYTVTVTARGDDTTYADGPTSDESAANVKSQKYTLTLQVNSWEGGYIDRDPSGQYSEGEQVNASATANFGYHFVNWTVDGNPVDWNSNILYTMPAANVTLVANFEADIIDNFE